MKLTIQDQTISYTVRKSKISRRIRLSISGDGGLTVTLPERANDSIAEKFIKENSAWVFARLDFIKKHTDPDHKKLTTGDYLKNKYKAYRIAKERVEHFNQILGYEYKTISIRNQKSCWGSCSSRKNLNFSFRIAFLPDELRDYVIVHELCHLKEMNHSAKFWDLVVHVLPNYRMLRRRIRPLGITL